MHKMLKIQHLPKTLQVPSLCLFFHNSEPQNAGLVDVKKGNIRKDQSIFVCENLKNKHRY